jgi:perosamine synthetase
VSTVAAEPTLATDVVRAIQSVVGSETRAALHEPEFGGNEWAYVKAAIDSTFVSSVGEFVDRFETELAAWVGARHVVAVANGTAALHLALQLAGVTRDDEVLTPALSFVATANAISYCAAIPHFVESSDETLGMDAAALRAYLGRIAIGSATGCRNRESGRRIRAMVPMHTFGHPAHIIALLAVADEFGITLIEDAAESLGSMVGARHTGTFGTMGTLSFNGNKTITTGGGGAIITDDPALARRAKHLSTTAKLSHRWDFVHDEIGYNYRMPNLNAALGCAQLEQLAGKVDRKRRLYARYAEAFSDVDGVTVLREPVGCRSNYWLQTLVLADAEAHHRDEILQATNDAGLMTRPAWTLMHHLPAFRSCPRMAMPVAESLSRRIVNIPSSAHLGQQRGPS